MCNVDHSYKRRFTLNHTEGLTPFFYFQKFNVREVLRIAKKLTKKLKDEIRLRFIVCGESLKDLAEEYKLSYSYLKWISSKESWALLTEKNDDDELKAMYNEALVSKSYRMLDVYGKIMEKALAMLERPVKAKSIRGVKDTNKYIANQKLLESKDLINITNVIKIVEQRQFVLLLLREDKENG